VVKRTEPIKKSEV